MLLFCYGGVTQSILLKADGAATAIGITLISSFKKKERMTKMAFRCKLWERECNGCQNCMEDDVYIDAVCYDLAGEFLDFNSLDARRYKEDKNE